MNNSTAAATMMEKYGLVQDEALMNKWLDQTHGSNHMPWREYLLFWSQGKEQFLTKLFNGQLIHKFDISFSKTLDEMCREMDYSREFCIALNECMNSLNRVFINFLVRRYDTSFRNADFALDKFHYGNYIRAIDILERDMEDCLPDKEREFLTSMSPMVERLHNVLFRYASLADNRCEFSATFRIPEASKPFQIVDNQKPFKALTALAKYMKPYVEENLTDELMANIEAFRIVHSQILNTKNTRGRLCLSIHPMDYMTMSDNGCDWHSCMRWEDGEGEYHAGTVEMMTSSSVIVAYLESKDQWFPVHGEKAWSNKKWRELFIVTPDFITGIKGYPYCSDTLENAVFEKLAELMKQNCGIAFNTKDVCRREGCAVTPSDANIYFKTTIMYNDCSWNDVDTIFAENCSITEDKDFFYGEGAHCIRCGEIRSDSRDIEGCEDSLYCYDCSGRVVCSHCGEVIRDDDYETDPDGNPICCSCYDDLRHDDLIHDRWGYEDDFYEVIVHVAGRNGRNFRSSIWLRDDTFDDLRRAGAVDEVVYDFWSSRQTLLNPIPDDPDYQCLKDALAKWERDNDFTIQYKKPASQAKAEKSAAVSNYEF